MLHLNDLLDFLLLDDQSLEMVFDVDKGLGQEPYFDYQKKMETKQLQEWIEHKIQLAKQNYALCKT